ncbi:MAG: SPASM domain-containing protein [Clostridia bacterium]|nr:SPASM domain-containing protein [Clostridia bacterium]
MKKYSRAYVEITNVCNKDCSFCPGTSRAGRFMSREEFDCVANKLVGVTDYLYLHLMGEPLLHPELSDFIGLAVSRGFKCAVTTNGTLLTKCPELIDSGVYKVNISVHSFEDGADTDYRQYLNGCFDFADRASRAGILTVLRLWNRGTDGGRNIDTEALLHERFGPPESVGVRGERLRPRLHLEYGERFDWPSMDIESLGEHVFCHGLGDHFAVLSDGRVVPCCLDKDGDMTLGNVFCEDIEAILSSERARNIRDGFEKKRAAEELCRRCGYARRFKI